MKVSGFTIIRNAVKYDYPVIESITSALPLVDEFIVNVGESEDETLDLVRSISSEKIRILFTVWDAAKRTGGHVLADETNRALSQCTGDWCLYVQSDEVIHEGDCPAIRDAMQRYHGDGSVEALEFRYLHFYGSYSVIQDDRRNWYRRAPRIIRNRRGIVSVGDAMSFRVLESGVQRRCRMKQSGGRIFHYGWVKTPKNMRTKKIETDKLWFGDDVIRQEESIITEDNIYIDKGNLAYFKGTHPRVMLQRVSEETWTFSHGIESQPPTWVRHILIFLRPITKRIGRILGMREKTRCYFR